MSLLHPQACVKKGGRSIAAFCQAVQFLLDFTSLCLLAIMVP